MKDFYMMRREAKLDIGKTAKLFDVTPRTVRNWEKTNKPPQAVFLYLSVLCGQLDHLGQDWKGFKFLDGCILSDNGDHLHAWEVRAIRYLWIAAGLDRGRMSRVIPIREKPELSTNFVDNVVMIPKERRGN